jgi:antitoxin CcdA
MRMAKKHLEDPARPFRGKIGGSAPADRRENPRRAVNVSVNAHILAVAKEMNINLSQVLERELDKLTMEERARRFYQEHKAFFDLHNELAEKYGTLSEQFAREFGDDDQTV